MTKDEKQLKYFEDEIKGEAILYLESILKDSDGNKHYDNIYTIAELARKVLKANDDKN